METYKMKYFFSLAMFFIAPQVLAVPAMYMSCHSEYEAVKAGAQRLNCTLRSLLPINW